MLVTKDRDALSMPVVDDLVTRQSRELDVPEGVATFGWSAADIATDGDRVIFQHTTPTRRP